MRRDVQEPREKHGRCFVNIHTTSAVKHSAYRSVRTTTSGAARALATFAAADLMFAQISREGAVLAFGDAYRVTLVQRSSRWGLRFLLPAHPIHEQKAIVGSH
jgi:hypothetical protein